CAEILEKRRAALRQLGDRKLFQQRRRPQHFAEAVASGEAEADRRRRGIDEELEEQTLPLAAVPDLAHAEEAAVRVGEEWVVDAALREDIFLHADGEEMLERTAAALHDVAEPDSRVASRGSRVAKTLLLQRVTHGFNIEAAVPDAGPQKGGSGGVSRRA